MPSVIDLDLVPKGGDYRKPYERVQADMDFIADITGLSKEKMKEIQKSLLTLV